MAAMTMADRAPGADVLVMRLGARLDTAEKQIDRGSALRPVLRTRPRLDRKSRALRECRVVAENSASSAPLCEVRIAPTRC